MVSFLTVINMTGNNDHKANKQHKTDFKTRFENFHEKHPEPWNIYGTEMWCNFYRSQNCSTKFLIVLKSTDTIDNLETIADMLLVKKSLETKFGSSNVYWEEGHFGWISIYLFFDFEALLSRTLTR